MKSLLLKLTTPLLAATLITSCGSASKPKPTPVKRKAPVISSRAALARKILAHPNITLLRKQVSGRHDGASAYDNIASTARGYSARRSSYGRAPGGYARLNTSMLRTMLYLANNRGYHYRVTAIAGGSHSSNSRHYRGVAFDVDQINGRKVRYGNPYMNSFKRIARANGATEVLGPGDRGHRTHLHFAWPR